MFQNTRGTTNAAPNILYEALQILAAAGRNFFLLDTALSLQETDTMAHLLEHGCDSDVCCP